MGMPLCWQLILDTVTEYATICLGPSEMTCWRCTSSERRSHYRSHKREMMIDELFENCWNRAVKARSTRRHKLGGFTSMSVRYDER